VPEERDDGLHADCARCFGLCCVAPALTASADFAIDKPAGQPCPNLAAGAGDFRCRIHSRLRQEGFPGCTVYDCFGAGQKVAQATFGGRDWRQAPGTAPRMFAVFAVMRQLHELLWYLTEALRLVPALDAELREALRATARLTDLDAEAILAVDLAAHRRAVNTLLLEASRRARGSARRGPDRSGADLAGKDLRRADLRGANLRGTHLTGADLRDADLRGADLTGADLRGADLAGADLRGSIFVTQAQLDSARGDRTTRLPDARTRPAPWIVR